MIEGISFLSGNISLEIHHGETVPYWKSPGNLQDLPNLPDLSLQYQKENTHPRSWKSKATKDPRCLDSPKAGQGLQLEGKVNTQVAEFYEKFKEEVDKLGLFKEVVSQNFLKLSLKMWIWGKEIKNCKSSWKWFKTEMTDRPKI